MSELKDVPGYEGLYGVTKDGRVWDYLLKRFLKLILKPNGYCVVRLYKINRTRKYYQIHRLVMAAYDDLDLNDTQTVVHHINGDSLDNRLENLQIISDYEHRCHHNPMRAKGYGINTETHKVCTKCEVLKLRSGFSVSRNCPDGLQNWCKSCRNECGKKYYQKLKEKRQHERSICIGC